MVSFRMDSVRQRPRLLMTFMTVKNIHNTHTHTRLDQPTPLETSPNSFNKSTVKKSQWLFGEKKSFKIWIFKVDSESEKLIKSFGKLIFTVTTGVVSWLAVVWSGKPLDINTTPLDHSPTRATGAGDSQNDLRSVEKRPETCKTVAHESVETTFFFHSRSLILTRVCFQLHFSINHLFAPRRLREMRRKMRGRGETLQFELIPMTAGSSSLS